VRARYGATERLIVDDCAYLFDLVLAFDHRICEQLQLLLLLGCHGSTVIRISSNNNIPQYRHLPHNNITNSCTVLSTAHHPFRCCCRSRIVDAHMDQNFGGQTHVPGRVGSRWSLQTTILCVVRYDVIIGSPLPTCSSLGSVTGAHASRVGEWSSRVDTTVACDE